MNSREKIIQVFETIAHGQLGLSPDAPIDLQSAQLLLEPRLQWLREELRECFSHDRHLENLIAAESVTAYTVGVLSGLDLAGRPDIVGKFADAYAAEAKAAVDSLFAAELRAVATRRVSP